MSSLSTAMYMTIPALRGQQAARVMYLCLPTNEELNFGGFTKEAEVFESQKTQRRYDEDRAEEIVDYMVESQASFVLGALTYSIDRECQFIPAEPGANHGLLKVPMSAKIKCVDGQHRRGAIKSVVEQVPELSQHHTAVILYVESDIEARQQMFTDMNRHQKPVSKSVVINLDHRDPFARVTQRVVAEHPLLKGLIEDENTSVSKDSLKLFTIAAVYAALARLHTGAGGRLRTKDKYKEADIYTGAMEFFSMLYESRAELRAATADPAVIPTWRPKSILFSGTTLKMVAGCLFSLTKKHRNLRATDLRKALSGVDFSPSAAHWQNCGFVSKGKTTPNGRLQEVKAAADELESVLLAKLGK